MNYELFIGLPALDPLSNRMVLLNNIPNYRSKYIYECADDWCSKQVTTNGIVSYFKAYYGKYEGQEGSKANYQESKT